MYNIVEALQDAGYQKSTQETLGEFLEVPDDKINEFERNNPDDTKQVRRKIIKYWLQYSKNPPKDWNTIANVAEKLEIKNKAEKIRSEDLI